MTEQTVERSFWGAENEVPRPERADRQNSYLNHVTSSRHETPARSHEIDRSGTSDDRSEREGPANVPAVPEVRSPLDGTIDPNLNSAKPDETDAGGC